MQGIGYRVLGFETPNPKPETLLHGINVLPIGTTAIKPLIYQTFYAMIISVNNRDTAQRLFEHGSGEVVSPHFLIYSETYIAFFAILVSLIPEPL
jgi:hypothetical protein